MTPSETDGRVRIAELTSAGQAERAELDRLSDDAAGAILGPLTGRQRDRLITAMAEVERLLAASAIELAGTDPRAPGALACQRAYASELAVRFEAGYDPAQTMTVDDAELTPRAGLLLVASLHGEPVGCGAVILAGAGQAESGGCGCRPRSAASGSAAGSWPGWRRTPRRPEPACSGWRPTARSPRRSACTGRPGTARCPR